MREQLTSGEKEADEARSEAVELSGRFNVASRFTSLLVLESPAMFKAFGLNNERKVAEWTGEAELRGDSADAEGEADEPTDKASAARLKSKDAKSDLGFGADDDADASAGAGIGMGRCTSSATSPPRSRRRCRW